MWPQKLLHLLHIAHVTIWRARIRRATATQFASQTWWPSSPGRTGSGDERLLQLAANLQGQQAEQILHRLTEPEIGGQGGRGDQFGQPDGLSVPPARKCREAGRKRAALADVRVRRGGCRAVSGKRWMARLKTAARLGGELSRWLCTSISSHLDLSASTA